VLTTGFRHGTRGRDGEDALDSPSASAWPTTPSSSARGRCSAERTERPRGDREPPRGSKGGRQSPRLPGGTSSDRWWSRRSSRSEDRRSAPESSSWTPYTRPISSTTFLVSLGWSGDPRGPANRQRHARQARVLAIEKLGWYAVVALVGRCSGVAKGAAHGGRLSCL
jgi:hypothetical protein